MPSLVRHACRFIALLTLFGTGPTVGVFAQPAEVAGTRVSLTPPAGFAAAEQFPGTYRPAFNAVVNSLRRR